MYIHVTTRSAPTPVSWWWNFAENSFARNDLRSNADGTGLVKLR